LDVLLTVLIAPEKAPELGAGLNLGLHVFDSLLTVALSF